MTVPFAYRVLILAGVAALSAPALRADDALDPKDVAFFEKKIRPVLVKHCYECHSADSDDVSAGLYVDSREGLLTGGEMGAAVVPGNVNKSLLIQAIEYRDIEMPPDGKLPDDVIRDFRRWVRMGAPDPRTGTMPVQASAADDASPAADLWSLEPVGDPEPPVLDSDWPASTVDQFVHARHVERGLTPVADAESLVLLRRLCFDLTGLPPNAEQIAAIQADASPEAFSTLIDELLASPAYGERWGRHWLDVVRYGESAGSSRDVLMPHAWRYRNYVIDAFNSDVPYDRFIAEQIAGDLLPAESPEDAKRMLVATGLLAIGSKSLNGGNVPLDLIDDQIDVIGKSMLGLTISCARCHDHKFDPIPTADYYALAGIFKSTETLYGGGIRRPKDDARQTRRLSPAGRRRRSDCPGGAGSEPATDSTQQGAADAGKDDSATEESSPRELAAAPAGPGPSAGDAGTGRTRRSSNNRRCPRRRRGRSRLLRRNRKRCRRGRTSTHEEGRNIPRPRCRVRTGRSRDCGTSNARSNSSVPVRKPSHRSTLPLACVMRRRSSTPPSICAANGRRPATSSPVDSFPV